jgi:hypothetical protein
MDKKYLGAWDLPHPVTVKISKVEGVKLEGTGAIAANKKPVISFHRAEKKLICNATIGLTIQGMYGPNVEDWIDKKITLFATTCQGKGGGQVDCVRVKPMIPKGQDQALESQPVNEEMRANQMAQAGETTTQEPGEEG